MLAWDVFYEQLVTKEGYKNVLVGLRNTVIIAVLGLIIGILIGTAIAIVRVMPKYKRLPRVLDKICTVYVAFFRGTPIVVQLLIGYYVLLPLTGINLSALSVCVIIFGMNSGAYVSEIMRSGILSVDPGQLDAGRALGLSYPTAMLKIVVPQAVKNIIPTIGNEFISLIKETSIVSFVSTVDLYVAFKKLASVDYLYTIPYLAMALVYIILVLIITLFIRLIERRLRVSDKRS